MRLESQMLNETFNNIPVEQETEDEDVGLYRNVRVILLRSFSRNNKSKEVKLNIYPLSDCQALYIIQVHLNIYLHFLKVKLLLRIKRRLTPSVTVKH